MLGYWKHPQSNRVRLYLPDNVVVKIAGCQPNQAKLWFEEDRRSKRGWKLNSKGLDGSVSAKDLEPAAVRQIGMEAPTWHDLLSKISTSTPAKNATKGADKSPTPSAAGWKDRQAGSRAGEAANLDVSSIRMAGTVTIEIDHRETPEVGEALDAHPQIEVVRRTLDLGDFRVVDSEGNELLIERKHCTNTRGRTDFESSVVSDGRLFDQSERLKFARANSDNLVVPVFVIEGDLYSNSQSMLVQQIDGALGFLSAIQQVSVLPTLNANHSAYVIAKLATHFAHGLFTPVTLHKAKPKQLDEQKLYILQALPGVSRGLAEALLEQFGSIAAVMTASDEQLLSVAGMGKKRVAALREALS